jgi:ankyrin repeat protein
MSLKRPSLDIEQPGPKKCKKSTADERYQEGLAELEKKRQALCLQYEYNQLDECRDAKTFETLLSTATAVRPRLLADHAARGNADICKLLLEYKVDVNSTSEPNECNALMRAARNNHYHLFDMFIKHGVNINARSTTPRRASAFAFACVGCDLPGIQILAAHTTEFACDGGDVLHNSLFQRKREIVEFVHTISKLPILCDSNYLVYACGILGQSPEVVQWLIDKGCNVDTRDSDGHCSLGYAIFSNNPEVCRVLIQNGADVNTVTTDDQYMLEYAVELGHAEICEILCLFGAVVHRANTMHIFHYAVKRDYIDICKTLIEYKANVNDQSPLRSAIRACNRDMVCLLLANGAEPINMPGARTPEIGMEIFRYGSSGVLMHNILQTRKFIHSYILPPIASVIIGYIGETTPYDEFIAFK